MSGEETAQRLIAALAYVGFVPEIGPGPLAFRGAVVVRGSTIPLKLVYETLEFADLPHVYVEDAREIPRAVVAHLDDKAELCVIDRDRFVSDRYLIVEQSLGLLERAKEVLTRNWTSESEREIAAEFPQHWGQSTIKLALNDRGTIAWVTCDKNEHLQIVSDEPLTGKKERCGVVRTTKCLSFTPQQSYPSTFGALLSWAKHWDLELPDSVVRAVAALHPNDPLCVIEAPNGTIAFQVLLHERSPKLASVLNEREAWKKYVLAGQADGLEIRRLLAKRAGLEYILSRCTNGVIPLRNKRVVLVGCGAIGGYLSNGLVRLGAGFSEGRLVLVDKDALAEANLGRHILGSEFLDSDKAQACKAQIDRDLPGLNVSARHLNVEADKLAICGADLVVDATGEQAIGELLNDWFIARDRAEERSPAMIHVWLEGQGAAAFTYFSTDRQFACYRCLRPNHEAQPRYRALRETAPTDLAGGCGEAPYTPYGAAAPMLAAAMAVQHVLDWTRGQHRPLLRVNAIDLHRTYLVKPANPTRSDHCPACAKSAAV